MPVATLASSCTQVGWCVTNAACVFVAAAACVSPPTIHHQQPVMVLGSGASAVTLLWFGLSGSYAGAATARVVAGLLNGIIVSW
jgi:predicted MFS family arabinose efflux permease